MTPAGGWPGEAGRIIHDRRPRVASRGTVVVALALLAAAAPAWADDRAEVSTSVFAEKRDGSKGGLIVVHPQADFGIDLGRFVSLDVS
ncbi:MAG: hypothetical protein ABIY55_13765, partial [Kofleriaceae bacterium]